MTMKYFQLEFVSLLKGRGKKSHQDKFVLIQHKLTFLQHN